MRRLTNDSFVVEIVGVADVNDRSIDFIDIPVSPTSLGNGVYDASYAAPDLQFGDVPGVTWPTRGPWRYRLSILVPASELFAIHNSELTADLASVDATVPFWNTYDATMTIGDNVGDAMKGEDHLRQRVIKVEGGNTGFSHMWQTFDTVPGQRYRLRLDVFVDTDGIKICNGPGADASTDVNGDIGCWGNGGVDVIDATQCVGSYEAAVGNSTGENLPGARCFESFSADFVNAELSSEAQAAAEDPTIQTADWKGGDWTELVYDLVAKSERTAVRLHVSGGFYWAYFDRISLDTHIADSPFNVTIISTFEPSIAVAIEAGRQGSTAAGNGLSGSTAGIRAEFFTIPRNPLGLRQDPSTTSWQPDYFNVTLAGIIREVMQPERGSADDRYYVEYLMTRAGTYELSIRLDTPGSTQVGMHIEESPKRIAP